MNGESNGYMFRETWHSFSTELFELSIDDKMRCCSGKNVMTIERACDCQECIGIFVTYERVVDGIRRNWEKEIVNDN